MSDKQTITIKLKPYLQEYLRCKLQEPLTASKRNIIGIMIQPFLEIRPRSVHPQFATGNDSITFDLPVSGNPNTRHGTVYISEENQKHFEKILDAHFKDLFFSFADDKIRYTILEAGSNSAKNPEIKSVILQFCADFNISFNNITYEMLKKSYYRRRVLLEGNDNTLNKVKKFSTKLSLSCPLIFLI